MFFINCFRELIFQNLADDFFLSKLGQVYKKQFYFKKSVFWQDLSQFKCQCQPHPLAVIQKTPLSLEKSIYYFIVLFSYRSPMTVKATTISHPRPFSHNFLIQVTMFFFIWPGQSIITKYSLLVNQKKCNLNKPLEVLNMAQSIITIHVNLIILYNIMCMPQKKQA